MAIRFRLYLYKQKMMYRVDSVTRKCVTSRIPDSRQWRPFGVPKNATFLQQEMIGVPGANFLAHEYVIRSVNHPNNCECLPSNIDCIVIAYSSSTTESTDISRPNTFMRALTHCSQSHTV